MTDALIEPTKRIQGAAFERPDVRRRRWSWLAKGTTASLGISLATGLHLYFFAPFNWNAGQIVLGVHLAAGLLATALFVAWQIEHMTKGLRLARSRAFLVVSWLYFALYVVLLTSGVAIAAPFLLYLAGFVWFYKFETTDLIAKLHLYLAVTTTVCFFAHLLMPHWPKKRNLP